MTRPRITVSCLMIIIAVIAVDLAWLLLRVDHCSKVG
jgi:hypothetical protein